MSTAVQTRPVIDGVAAVEVLTSAADHLAAPSVIEAGTRVVFCPARPDEFGDLFLPFAGRTFLVTGVHGGYLAVQLVGDDPAGTPLIVSTMSRDEAAPLPSPLGLALAEVFRAHAAALQQHGIGHVSPHSAFGTTVMQAQALLPAAVTA